MIYSVLKSLFLRILSTYQNNTILQILVRTFNKNIFVWKIFKYRKNNRSKKDDWDLKETIKKDRFFFQKLKKNF